MPIDPTQLSQIFSLLNLSAPGLNRPLGAGDVVPYTGAQSGGTASGNTQVAQPGPSFNPLGGSGASPFAPGSLLQSLLSSLGAAQQGIGNANVPSGQGNALPSTYAATPGIGSTDINNVLNTVNAPSAGGVLPTNVQPIGGTGPAAAPTPAPTTTVGGGDAGVSGGPGPGPGGAPGNAGAVAGEAAGGPGAPGTPGGADAPGVGVGGPGDSGGAPGGTVICSYLLRHLEEIE